MMRACQKYLPAPFPRQKVVIKHTFIEVADADSEAHSPGMKSRSLSDSDLLESLSPQSRNNGTPGAGNGSTGDADAPRSETTTSVTRQGELPRALPVGMISMDQARSYGYHFQDRSRPMKERIPIPTVFGVSMGDSRSASEEYTPPTSPHSAPTLLQSRRSYRERSPSGKKERRRESAPLVPVQTAIGATEAQLLPSERTTVMLRNIPNNYSRACLLDLLDKKGLQGTYDFVYLPLDFRTGAALGYAFVNLVDPRYVPQLWSALDRLSQWKLPSRKRCSVTWSHPYQGFEENVDRYRNSPVMHGSIPDSHKPAVFRDGLRVPFPPPTKTIKPPRIR